MTRTDEEITEEMRRLAVAEGEAYELVYQALLWARGGNPDHPPSKALDEFNSLRRRMFNRAIADLTRQLQAVGTSVTTNPED